MGTVPYRKVTSNDHLLQTEQLTMYEEAVYAKTCKEHELYSMYIQYVLYVLYVLYALYVLYVLYILYALYVLCVLYVLYILYLCIGTYLESSNADNTHSPIPSHTRVHKGGQY